MAAVAALLAAPAALYAEPAVSGTSITNSLWVTDTADPDYDSGRRAASAEFQISGSDLLINLTNTSGVAASNNNYVLSGLFFDVADSVSLDGEWAYVAPGESRWRSTTRVNTYSNWTNVSERWAFRDDLGDGENPNGQQFGIAATTFDGVFGRSDQFDTSRGRLGDLHYSLIPESGVTSNFSGDFPLISNSTVFKLSNWGGRSLDLITNVDFQYGNPIGGGYHPNPGPDPSGGGAVPEPATATLALLSLGALGFTTRRRRQA